MTVIKEKRNGVWQTILVGEAGPTGPAGPAGPQGSPGVGAGGTGLTNGGATGTVLAKRSGTDYDTVWQPKDVVDVRDFGAKTDGTDSSLAIQAADDSLPNGGKVVFPAGDYNIGTTTINKNARTVWVGAGNHPTGAAVGSELKYSGESNAVKVTASSTAQWYGRIEGMRILYGGTLGAATTSTGIYVSTGASSQVIRDCYIVNFQDAIVCDATSGLRLQMIYTIGATRYGCHIINTTDCYVGEYSQLSGGVYGLFAESCGGLMINDSRMQASGTANVHILGGGQFQMTGGLCDSADVSLIAGDRKGVMLTGVKYSRISDVTFYANGTMTDIEVFTPTGAPTQQLNVTGCVFQQGGGAKSAIIFRAPAAIASRIAIVGNSVDNVTEPLVTFEAPAAGGSYSNVVVTGNAAAGGVIGAANVPRLVSSGNTWDLASDRETQAMTFLGSGGPQATGLTLPLNDQTIICYDTYPTGGWTGGAAAQFLAGQYTTTGNQRKVVLTLLSTGILRFTRSFDGIATSNIDSLVPIPKDAGPLSVAAAYSNTTLRVGFYTSPDPDGEGWTALGPIRTFTVNTPFFNATAPTFVGGSANPFTGRIKAVSFRNGTGPACTPGGTEIGRVTGGTFPQTDAYTNAWTLTGTASSAPVSARSKYASNMTLDVRDFVVGNMGPDDDWSVPLNKAVAEASRYNGTVLLPTMSGFINAPVNVNLPCTIQGTGSFGTELIAGSGLTGSFMFNFEPMSGAGLSNFLLGATMRDIALEGNGRTVDCGAIRVRSAQRLMIDHVQARYFARSGFYVQNSMRNSRINNLFLRHNADLANGWADIQLFDDVAGLDASNLNVFTGVETFYPYGRHLWMREASPGAAALMYQNTFRDCQFHGTATSGTWHEVTIAADPVKQIGGILIQGTDRVNFENSFHFGSRDGTPAIMTESSDVGGGLTTNIIKVNSSFFHDMTTTDTAISSVDPATDIITVTGTGPVVASGGIVRFTTTGVLPAGLALATDYYARPLSPTTFTVHTTFERARTGVTLVNITDVGTGTHTVVPQRINVWLNRISAALVHQPTQAGTRNRPSIVNKHPFVNNVTLSGLRGPTSYEGPPVAGVDVTAGFGRDAEVGSSMIIPSPDGSRWQVTVSNAGAITTVKLP